MHPILPENTCLTETRATESGASRRAVLRGAAAAAWTVPAVTLAKPTFAAATSSVSVPVLTGLSETASGFLNLVRTLKVSVPLNYSSSRAFDQGSVITVTVKDPSSLVISVPDLGPLPTGWAQWGSATQTPGNSRAWVFTFRTTSASPTVPFTTAFGKLSANTFRSQNPTVIVTVTPVGGTSSSHVLSWP